MTLDDQLAEAFERLADRLRDELARELRTAAADALTLARIDRDQAVEDAATRARAEAEQRADAQVQTAAAEAAASVESAGLIAGRRLVDAVRALDGAASLTEILDTLVSCAGREIGRVAVLLVQGRELHGWRFIGFGPAFESASSIVISLEESGIIAEAIRIRAAIPTDTAGDRSAPGFAEVPGGCEGLALPIVVSGDVVAVLYADRGAADDAASRPAAASWGSTLELLARHASRCLEAVTAINAVRVLSESPQIRFRAASTGADGGSPDPSRDREEAAARYARLLVSEIKLYHELAVADGRRERDLATRLAGEIARARLLYEQRVAPETRLRADYFHDELVRTLAEGDPSLLERS